MTQPELTPIIACENAIDHWTKVEEEATAEAGRLKGRYEEAVAVALNAHDHQVMWIKAKRALLAAQESENPVSIAFVCEDEPAYAVHHNHVFGDRFLREAQNWGNMEFEDRRLIKMKWYKAMAAEAESQGHPNVPTVDVKVRG